MDNEKKVIFLDYLKCKNDVTDAENIEEGNGNFSFLLFFIRNNSYFKGSLSFQLNV